MTVLHQLRAAALRCGVAVERASATPGARLCRLLRRRGVDIVIDVGANTGQYGRQLRTFGYRGAIASFEPLPTAYQELARRTVHDPTWTTRNLALGDLDGTVPLHVAGNQDATSSSLLPMLPRHQVAAPGSAHVGRVDVPMRCLDAVWEETVGSADRPFLKVDVQGFEGSVLDGATRSSLHLVGLQLEISLVPLYEGALSIRDVLDRADELDMDLVHVEPGFSDPRTDELLQMDGLFMRRTAR